MTAFTLTLVTIGAIRCQQTQLVSIYQELVDNKERVKNSSNLEFLLIHYSISTILYYSLNINMRFL